MNTKNKLIFCGNSSIDHIITTTGTKNIIGGSAVNSAIAAANQTDKNIAIISSVGSDFPVNILDDINIDTKYIKENTGKFDADVDLIKIKASRQKSALEKNIADARQDVKKAREKLTTATDRLMELKIQKELNVLEKELKKKEEDLFLDQARIDIATEDEIDNIRGTDGIEFKLYQIFDVEIG